MKKATLFIALSFVLFVAACKNGGSKSGDASSNPLKELGVNLSLKYPEGSTIAQNMAGVVEIKKAKDFQISISPGSGDLELWKQDIKANEVNKFKRFVVEEADALFYECEFSGKPEFHFMVVKRTADGLVYEMQDNKGEIFSEAQCKAMFEAAKNATILN